MNEKKEPDHRVSSPPGSVEPRSDPRGGTEAAPDAQAPGPPPASTPAHPAHELQTHHRELETQNERLRHEQILFQNLIKAIPDHIYFKDRQSRFVRINDTMAQKFGLANPSGAVGKKDFDFFTEEHARQAFDDEQRIMRTGEPLIGVEEKETWPDGHVTWASSTKVPLRDAAGNITGLVGISRDITERKWMEEALAEQAETYRALLSTALDGVIEVDEQLHIVDANQVYCRLLGYTKTELLGRRLHEVEGNETHEHVKRHAQRLQREGGGRFETRHRAKDGRLVDLELNVTYIPNRNRFIAFCHDITRRKRTAAVLQDSEARFRTLANSGQTLIWTSGPDKRCDYFNQPWLDFTGRTLDQELGDGWADGVHPDDRAGCLKISADAFDRRERFSREYRLRRKDGVYRWVHDDVCPYHDSQEVFLGFIGHALDITETRQAQEALRQVQAEARPEAGP
jgi:PAS domain S-box-containing protein